MKYLAILTITAVLAGCDANSAPRNNSILTYDEVVRYPVDCAKRSFQQKELQAILDARGMDPDPDKLSNEDRLYNSKLKATYWWFEYTCGNPA